MAKKWVETESGARMLVKRDDAPSGGKFFGKTHKEWSEGYEKKKKDVEDYFSAENRKTRRKKRAENRKARKKQRMTSKSERVDKKIQRRKRRTKKMEERNKKRKEELKSMKHGGSVGTSIRTYASGGYVEGK